jgi:AAHS family 4-hydroxybenzoate transporter-like MFS transporter
MADMATAAIAAEINVSDVVDNARLRPFHFRVVALCAALIFFDGFDLQAISYAAPAVAKVLGFTRPQLGPVFSAGLLGLTLGALLFGYLGDRLGRKNVFIACGVMFGLASFGTTTADSLTSLLVWRVVAGLALGGATPLSITIATDTCPRRVRATLTMIMYTGFTLGGVFGGFVYAKVGGWGWEWVFYIGGAIPILMAPLLMLALPESIDYLVLKRAAPARIRRLLASHAPGRSWEAQRYVTNSPAGGGFQVAALFTEGRAPRTLLLWSIFFTSLVALFFFTTWLPTLLNGNGLSPERIVSIVFAVQMGGLVGSLILARVIVTVSPFVTICAGYLLAAVAMFGLSRIGGAAYPVLFGVSFVVGLFLVGTQNGLNAMSAQLYPASIRSTGVGWAIGVGRIGAVLGPSIAGVLVSLQWTASELFAIAAVPPFVAAGIALAIAREVRG